MGHQAINLGFGFTTEGNHALRARSGFTLPDCIWLMRTRSRSSTGSIGTVSPASAWASLRSSDSTIQRGGVLSAMVSMGSDLVLVSGRRQ